MEFLWALLVLVYIVVIIAGILFIFFDYRLLYTEPGDGFFGSRFRFQRVDFSRAKKVSKNVVSVPRPY